MMYDVIVAGLGPAGSVAAGKLALNGLSVLALDKEKFPRYKSCGGCVSAKIDKIEGLDISEAVEGKVFGATYSYKSGRYIDVMSDKCVGYNVMRDRFDAMLVDKAKANGVDISEGRRVSRIEDRGDYVTVRTDEGAEYKGRYLVGADGAGGVIGRQYFGFNKKACAVSVTTEIPLTNTLSDDLKGRLFIDFGSVPYGYSWIFPKEKFLSVGLATETCRTGTGLRDYLSELISSHKVLKGVNTSKIVGWTIPLFYDTSQTIVKGRVVAVGDAGHIVDPFLGEGIYFAIRTGELAADVITECAKSDSSDLSLYQKRVGKEIFAEFAAAEKLSKLVYNHPRMWYRTLEGDEQLMKRYYKVIQGEESYIQFYDWVINRLKSRPWKLAGSWLKSRWI